MNLKHVVIPDVAMQTPLVSICCFTYNQEHYIKQTIESLLMQRTSFPFEIIIHDDASTDNNQQIIKEYAEEYPHIIKPIFQNENKYSKYGINYQFANVSRAALGKYIAYCDGDDYWIDPLKLQKQVGFLEANSDYGLVHTKAVVFNEAKMYFEGSHGYDVLSFEDLLFENSIASLTVCLRTSLLRQYFDEVMPENYVKWAAEDFPTWLWFIKHTKIKFMEDVTSVYRKRIGSISHIKDDFKRLYFSEGIYDIVNYYLTNYDLQEKTENKIRARYYSNMVNMYFLNKNMNGIRESIKIFYDAKDWLNLLWIVMTSPFYFSRFMIKGSYRMRSNIFNIFKLYPIRK